MLGVVALVFLVSFLPRELNATETITFDGVWWQGLSDLDKTWVVEGMMVGLRGGYQFAEGSAQQVGASHQVISGMQSAWTKSTGRTVGTVVDRIDAVYRDHPSMMGEHVGTFAACAALWDDGCEGIVKWVENRHG